MIFTTFLPLALLCSLSSNSSNGLIVGLASGTTPGVASGLSHGLASGLLGSVVAQDHDRQESPFEALRWTGEQPEAQIDGVWYRPVSIHDVPLQDILAFCQARWPGQIRKRFAEDMVEAMVEMGKEPPAQVDLVVVRLSDDVELTLESVEMSRRNRNALRDALNLAERRNAPARTSPPTAPSPKTLPRAEAELELLEFQGRLEDQFSYLHWKGIDLDAEMQAIRAQLSDPVSTPDLADRLNQLLLRFGDGHASVRSSHAPSANAYPAALLVEADGGVAAIKADRSGFLDPRRPYVARIDGKSIEDWVDALRPWIVDGSEHCVRDRALRSLRQIEDWRRQLQLPAAEEVEYELAEKPGARRGKKLRVPLQSRRPIYGDWPTGRSRLLEQNVGYLRLPAMDDDQVPALRQAMKSFEDSEGLIVDVRGNGGGSRGLLLALAGYLIAPEEGPWVGNAAVYRKSRRFDDDHLVARFMARAGAFDSEQAEVVNEFAASFEPEWDPGEGFSEWHYLVLDRTGHPGEYFYDRPVVILSDAHCFSATDIFLGALSGRPRVTLMGSASGGGSARSQGFSLPRSGIEVRCASMASFRPDGRLYDGRGIEVDVEIPANAAAFLVGGKDKVLEAALSHVLDR